MKLHRYKTSRSAKSLLYRFENHMKQHGYKNRFMSVVSQKHLKTI
nr:MAG TPA: hypothetical protein [Caudoviricetes sp.]